MAKTFSKKRLEIDTGNEFEVFQLGKRVFSIGVLNNDNDFVTNIVNILDNGFKFIPCYHINLFHIFKNLIFSFDQEMFNFNNQIFYFLKNCKNQNNLKLRIFEKNTNCSECFLKNFNIERTKNDKIPFLEHSINFQLDVLKELENLELEHHRNLTFNELLNLREFSIKKPFKVVELDKNIGAGIISNELYKKLALDLLNDKKVYLKIDIDPLSEIINRIENTLIELLNDKHLDSKLYFKLLPRNSKLGSFRILPKLHKNKFSCRPIINYKNHPVTFLCILVDLVLRPFVRNSESFIQDSQNLIQKTENMKFPKNSIICSGDFDSLYTNINHEDCINLIGDFLKDKFQSEFLDLFAFLKILELILKNNYFKFEEEFYIQCLGIAMGSKCGPSIANIFVYCYESKWLSIHKPLFYVRYIDDIFIIIDQFHLLESLKCSFGSLKLNIVYGDKINFLDLFIYLNKLTGNLVFSIYYKPTNTFCYLSVLSNHPDFIFENII